MDQADNHAYLIDFPAITEHLDPLSAGEQRPLRIAASIGSDDAPPVPLGEVLTGIDRPTLHLVQAAMPAAINSATSSSMAKDASR